MSAEWEAHDALDGEYKVYEFLESAYIDDSPVGIWVVRYVDKDGWFVVDCTGRCGEEPVRAGPYDSREEAEMVGLLVSRIDPVPEGKRFHP